MVLKERLKNKMEIISFTHFKDNIDIEERLKEIFFESSSVTNFSSEESKNKFYQVWLGHYLEFFAEETFVAFENEVLLGYITGCLNTFEYKEKLSQPGLERWTNCYENYPAHLHINCHRDARGQGIGGKLLSAFESHCLSKGVKGVHLITASSARNVGFYQKNGYIEVMHSGESPNTLVLLGKKLVNA